MPTMILGSNTMENCERVLRICGKEVFRLRERGGDGQVVADFDLCDEAGKPVAKVAKNNVVHAAAGMAVRHGPTFTEVVDAGGVVIGRAEEIAPDTVRVLGRFGKPGVVVHAAAEALHLPRGRIMARVGMDGFGVAVEIDEQGNVTIGKATPPVQHLGFQHSQGTPPRQVSGKRKPRA